MLDLLEVALAGRPARRRYARLPGSQSRGETNCPAARRHHVLAALGAQDLSHARSPEVA